MLRDILFENPHWVFSAVLIWVPVAIMIMTLINGMIMGEIDGIVGIFGLTAALGLGVIGMKPPHPSMTPVILAVAIGTLILAPVLRSAWTKRELTVMRIEAVESAYEALAQKSSNMGAQLKL